MIQAIDILELPLKVAAGTDSALLTHLWNEAHVDGITDPALLTRRSKFRSLKTSVKNRVF